MAHKQVGMPIGVMLGGNPFVDPALEDFRQQAYRFKDLIMYYALSKFYNIDINKYTIPTDMPCFIPTENEIRTFLNTIKNNVLFDNSSFEKICKEHFLAFTKSVKIHLENFKTLWLGKK